MSIIFTLCTLNSTLVNYYYNVKYTTYMVYFSIIMVVYFSITIYSMVEEELPDKRLEEQIASV